MIYPVDSSIVTDTSMIVHFENLRLLPLLIEGILMVVCFRRGLAVEEEEMVHGASSFKLEILIMRHDLIRNGIGALAAQRSALSHRSAGLHGVLYSPPFFIAGLTAWFLVLIWEALSIDYKYYSGTHSGPVKGNLWEHESFVLGAEGLVPIRDVDLHNPQNIVLDLSWVQVSDIFWPCHAYNTIFNKIRRRLRSGPQ